MIQSTVLRGAIRSIFGIANELEAYAKNLGDSASSKDLASLAEKFQVESERLRVCVIILRSEAARCAHEASTPGMGHAATIKPATPPTRTVQPCQQPNTCACGKGFFHGNNYRANNGEYRCNYCQGFVGYCGPNGCDFGLHHDCWRSEATAAPEAAL